MPKRRRRKNVNGSILWGLVLFAVGASVFCIVSESRGAESGQKKALEEGGEENRGEREETEEKRREEFSVIPGKAVGTLTPRSDRKTVYLTFDDGPSENTEKVLRILDQYDVKATFFITGGNEKYRSSIGEAYRAGHTIGLHSNTHDYASVYASESAYFKDLEQVGKVAEEQIGYIPCFVRFPGGSSNSVSAQYNEKIMTRLAEEVQQSGYQYYDWNVDSRDGGSGAAKDEIVRNSLTDKYNEIILLMHDSASKQTTVEALPEIIEYYQNRGYEFCAIDRKSFVSHHVISN